MVHCVKRREELRNNRDQLRCIYLKQLSEMLSQWNDVDSKQIVLLETIHCNQGHLSRRCSRSIDIILRFEIVLHDKNW